MREVLKAMDPGVRKAIRERHGMIVLTYSDERV